MVRVVVEPAFEGYLVTFVFLMVRVVVELAFEVFLMVRVDLCILVGFSCSRTCF